MSLSKKIFIVSSVIVLLSLLIQQYFPIDHEFLMTIPFAKPLASLAHKYIKAFYGVFEVSVPKNVKRKKKKERIMTVEDLKKYDGKPNSKGLYLALLGQVFDVKKGKQHYGPGGGYEFFAGCDASRAFISGDFTERGLIDDVTGLTSQDYLGLEEWLQFYKKDYKYIGKLIGRYYESNGDPTEYNIQLQNWIVESHDRKSAEDQEKQLFPSCNSEWFPDTGTRVWCTKKSGGIDRNWIGVPRQFFSPGKIKPRCACIKNFGPPSHDPKSKTHNNVGDLESPNLKEYEGCPKNENSCQVPK